MCGGESGSGTSKKGILGLGFQKIQSPLVVYMCTRTPKKTTLTT